jgi:parallel beta-helix repeat protein
MKHKNLLKAFLILVMVLAYLPLAHPAQATILAEANTRDGRTGSLPLESVRYAPPPPDLWVTNTNDSGPGSLRQAIIDANSSPGRERVAFNIEPSAPNNCDAGTGVCTIQPTTLLPWLSDDAGLIIDGYTQDGAARATATMPAVLKIELDGSSAGMGSGLWIDSSNNIIRGLAINRFNEGITIYDDGATNNVVLGNHIGTDASGMVDLGNINDGVRIVDGAQDNTIGGDEPADRNVISGNGQHGVHISDSGTAGNAVEGNFIGLAANGTDPLGNDASGIALDYGAANNTIGGSDSRHRNAISANDYGIEISMAGTASNAVSRNYIGTDAGGTLDRGNRLGGVSIHSDADNNTVEYNVISGNGQYGILISNSDGNIVSGNGVGVTANRVDPLGNASGILISLDADDNSIGPDNVIAHNNSFGVQVWGGAAAGNVITQNSIFSHTTGINLVSGANGGIAAPVIMSTTVGSVNIVGMACAGCTVEVFENSDTAGEGETYMGSAIADGSGDFTVTVSYLTKPYLTATATDETDGTSEFSGVLEATVELAPPAGPIYLPIVMKN